MEKSRTPTDENIPMAQSPFFKKLARNRWNDFDDSTLDEIMKADSKYEALVKAVVSKYGEPEHIARAEVNEWWYGPWTSWVQSGRTDINNYGGGVSTT